MGRKKINMGSESSPDLPENDSQLGGEECRHDITLPQRPSLKHQALQLFSQYGSLARVSRELGVDLYELHKLSRTDWWNRELQLLKREEAAIENTRLTNIFNRTLEEIEDVLINGEETIVEGKIRRKKLSGSSLARLADVVFNKRQLLREQPTSIEKSSSKLDEIAEKLEKLGQTRKPIIFDADTGQQEAEDER